MRKRLLKLFYLLVILIGIVSSAAHAQQKSISGNVKDETGDPLPGVAITVRGTTTGVVTDFEGNYALSGLTGDEVLVFSFMGMKSQEIAIAGKTVINVQLQEDAVGVDEVVVTALGIKRDKKALGYAVAQVKSKELMIASPLNLSSSLYGKAPGLSISQNSGGPTGGVKLNIRGINSLTGSNRPLIIMDGIPIHDNDSQFAGRDNIDQGSGISDINPDDIESVNVLKGASAAALYGSQAANGVILITTKKGTKSKGLGVSYSGSYTIEDVVIFEDLQNEFGGQLDEDAEGNLVYKETPWSFGPRMEGQMVKWWDGEMRPYSPQPDNMKDIYQQGFTSIQNLAVQNSFSAGSYRLGYTRYDYEGTTRGTEQAKNNFSLGVNLNVSEKLSVDASVNYYNIETTNPPIRTDRLIDWGFPRSAKMDLLREHTVTEDGYRYTDELKSEFVNSNIRANLCGPLFWNMTQNEWSLNTDRLVTSLTLKYQILDNLNFRLRGGSDFRTFNQQRKNPHVRLGSTAGSYFENKLEFHRKDYMEGLFLFNEELTDNLDLTLTAGGIIQNNTDNVVKTNSNGGLVIEDWYSISNSKNTPRGSNSRAGDRLYAVLGTGQLAYKDRLFVDLTARQDWSSILPPENNSYFYPSISSSLILSEALELPSVISFAKVRGSYAEVGMPGPRYKANAVYGYGNFNGVTTNSFGSSAPPLNLERELQTAWEGGFDVKLFDNRFGIDFTYFWNKNYNQILSLNVSQSSGSSGIVANVGELRNKGIEVQINANPIRTRNFNWDATVNISSTENEVVALANGIERLRVGGGWGVDVFASVGRPYGEFWLKKWKRVDGERVIDVNGLYVQDDDPSPFGTAPAKFFGGIVNNLTYKNWNLNVLVDYSLGGKMGSITNVRAMGMGRLKASLFGRDEQTGGIPYYINDAGDKVQLDSHSATIPSNSQDGVLYHDGIVPEGVSEILDSEGKPTGKFEKNTTIIDAEGYYRGNYAGGFGFAIEEAIKDNDYFKVREIALGYRLPNDWISRLGMENLTLSFIGRNLFYIYKSIPNIDPESAMGSSSFGYLEHTPYPNTRSFGFSLKTNF